MTSEEKKLEITIFLGMCKMLSAQGTTLIGEFKMDKKFRYNLAMKSLDNLIEAIEKDLSEYNKETLELIGEAMSDGIQLLRKELQEAV